jgi:hypothetical protein
VPRDIRSGGRHRGALACDVGGLARRGSSLTAASRRGSSRNVRPVQGVGGAGVVRLIGAECVPLVTGRHSGVDVRLDALHGQFEALQVRRLRDRQRGGFGPEVDDRSGEIVARSGVPLRPRLWAVPVLCRNATRKARSSRTSSSPALTTQIRGAPFSSVVTSRKAGWSSSASASSSRAWTSSSGGQRRRGGTVGIAGMDGMSLGSSLNSAG